MKNLDKTPFQILGLALLLASLAFFVSTEASAKAAKNVYKKAPAPLTEIILEDELRIADAQIVPDSEMGELRAGFMDPSGFLLKFAVDVKSQIDGALTFVRSLVLQHDHNGHLQASTSTELLSQNLPEGTTANVIDNGKGIVISNGSGQTTILNQTSSGALTNMIVNTANNVDVSQTMNIDLVLQNVSSIVGQLSALKNINAPAGIMNQASQMHRIGFGF